MSWEGGKPHTVRCSRPGADACHVSKDGCFGRRGGRSRMKYHQGRVTAWFWSHLKVLWRCLLELLQAVRLGGPCTGLPVVQPKAELQLSRHQPGPCPDFLQTGSTPSEADAPVATVRSGTCPETRAHVLQLIQKHGSVTNTCLVDPNKSFFSVAGIDGVIGFERRAFSTACFGDPVCRARDKLALALHFRAYTRAHFYFDHTIYLGASAEFADAAADSGFGSVCFGEERTVDPARFGLAAGESKPRGRLEAGEKSPSPSETWTAARNRNVRRNVSIARASGVDVREYVPPASGASSTAAAVAAALESDFERVVAAWMAGRRGLQVSLNAVKPFEAREISRWFYARDRAGAVVGLLTMLRIEGGYLAEHVVCLPGASKGTSELLIAHALGELRKEGCPGLSLGVAGTTGSFAVPESIRRHSIAFFVISGTVSLLNRAGKTDNVRAFRRKFGPGRDDPVYAVWDRPGSALWHLLGVFPVYRVSLRLPFNWSPRPSFSALLNGLGQLIKKERG